MESGTVLAIAIPVIVLLGLVVVATAARRRDTDRATGYLSRETLARDRAAETPVTVGAPSGRDLERATKAEQTGTAVAVAEPVAPVAWEPPDEDALGVTRRQFLNRSIIGAFVLSLSGFGASVLAFLWPTLSGGFGSKIQAGLVSELLADIADSHEPVYFPEGRFYINPYPTEAIDKAEAVYAPSIVAGMSEGVVALFQKCPHLGCRVPWCATSQWFECPCHGSKYNRVGEKKGGPAPRGMDRFPVSVEEGVVTVDTGTVVPGPAIGTDTTGQEAEGPHCLSGGH